VRSSRALDRSLVAWALRPSTWRDAFLVAAQAAEEEHLESDDAHDSIFPRFERLSREALALIGAPQPGFATLDHLDHIEAETVGLWVSVEFGEPRNNALVSYGIRGDFDFA